MTIDQMKNKKKELGFTYQMISDMSGVPLITVQRIFQHKTESPRYDTLQKLESVFSKYQDGRPNNLGYDLPATDMNAVYVRETAVNYRRTREDVGPGTVEEYLKTPDYTRIELIDGVFYDMGSPDPVHGFAITELIVQFRDYIKKKGGNCKVIPGPVDVQLDADSKTVVIPDLSILCDPSLIRYGRIVGAPDFVLEIVSPSNKENDYNRKLLKYYYSGVKEYWIVDPELEKVLVYDFVNTGLMPTIYGFRSEVPVRIYNGDCVIDFAAVADYMAWPPAAGETPQEKE